jgi:S1-C subfamily serine protease
MKPAFWPPLRRALALALVALALAAALGGCSLRPGFFQVGSTSTTLSTPAETWATATTTTTTTAPPKRPTSTSDWRGASSTTGRSTASTAGEEHPTTGDAKAIAAKFKPSVVLVTAVAETNTTGYFELEGTGVVYDTAGSYAYIVTNNHVIEGSDGKASKRIRVTLPSGSTVTATLIGRDPTTDLAVLRVKSKKVTAAVFRTDLSGLQADDFVVAIGKPKQLKRPIVSGNVIGFYQNVDYPDPVLTGIHAVIESTAPLEHGFSGGPLLDYKGRVIGINMAKFLDEPGGISLPADLVAKVVDGLMAAAQ